MAEKNAKIFLKSTQRLDGEEDTIELIAECGFYKNDDKYYVFYQEIYDDGVTDCNIKCEGDSVRIKRKGETNANFVCKTDEDTAFIYTTQYGHFSVIVHTKRLKVDLSEKGGEISLLYDLEINGVKQENEVEMRIERL